MATILLSAAGAAIGGAFGGTAFGLSSAVIGRAVGATLGRVVDQRLMGSGSEIIETGRIERFRLTGASEGTAVNELYGRVRVGGQIIWSTLFKERTRTSDAGGKGGGSSASVKSYSYSVSLAVALCEGEILNIGRIWADGMEVDRDDLDMRVYRGSEDQLPDPKIEAVEGQGNAPAYRGLAYVVFEDLKLARFGNRVPQFSFEVMKAADGPNVPADAQSLSNVIKGVSLVPGTGEYALATTPVHFSSGLGWNKSANINSASGKADFETSLTHLTSELPNCGAVSLVVSWFGNDLRVGRCNLAPKVEQTEIDGCPMPWTVSGVARNEATEVPRLDGRSAYGGTPTDQSVCEAINALRMSGKSVLFYPFILMDQTKGNDLTNPWTGEPGQPQFPWRGRITTERAPGLDGSTDGTFRARDEVSAFFGTAKADDFNVSGQTINYQGPIEWSFRRFILHYAHLCALAGGVDAFCIGSEMRGLTRVRGAGNTFPAVDELVSLAADVRRIVGTSTRIGYAADWSEYFGYHPHDGSGDVFFNLDPLWSSQDIDFIGIDNYMPLSDWRDGSDHADSVWDTVHNVDYLYANVAGGEGYDWYYDTLEGRDEQARIPISDGAHDEPWVYRYKDIRNWWSNRHHERVDGARLSEATAWIPQSKPIWFTELGCAAIDKATNQPNKFLDPKSTESDVPWYSNGARDDLIQAQYLRAMHLFWGDDQNNPTSDVYSGRMVDMSRAHVWAWDTRPFPNFPAQTDVWSDGGNYQRGHWLNGRTTSESLAAVVANICHRSGVSEVDVSGLVGLVRGYSVDESAGARSSLQPLSLAFGFDALEREGTIHFRSRNGYETASIDPGNLVSSDDGTISKVRAPVAESVGRVRINYVQSGGDFETRTTEASLPSAEMTSASVSDLPICLTDPESRKIAERWLAESHVARDTVQLVLPPSRLDIGPGDVIRLEEDNASGDYRIERVDVGLARAVQATRVERDLFIPGNDLSDLAIPKPLQAPLPVFARFLDLPLLIGSTDPISPFVAVTATPWPGSVALYSSTEDDDYRFVTEIEQQATIGVTETPLLAAAPGRIDRGAAIRVRLSGGSLSSVSEQSLLNGANAVAIGDGSVGRWEIFQFAEAELVAPNTYDLSNRLRGQLGTDTAAPNEWPIGSTVIILDDTVTQFEMSASVRGLQRHYRIGPADRALNNPSFTHEIQSFDAVGLRPYSPVHLRASRTNAGDFEFTWIRRTRIDGDSWEGIEIPLGEEAERYLVQVTVNDVLQKETVVKEPLWFYPVQEQQTDVIQIPFQVKVAQISERFGAGPFQRIMINE